MHVLPSLNSELQTPEVLAAALQPLLYMIEESTTEEYTELILPVFRAVFAMPKSVQATVTLLENMDIIMKKTPKSDLKSEVLPMLYNAFDSTTPQIQEACFANLQQACIARALQARVAICIVSLPQVRFRLDASNLP
ncbi:hypothetical protein AVEN_46257-1 [Araneus ventricosus]|uniref:SCY1-like protein 2 n=1 Tax=Araneus ventricosus TaxID=182803 RepID=A0A4Y2FEH0_ARAVE|nr:hypothetical protein AVEN_46257-1 [Araneus ventricosus]